MSGSDTPSMPLQLPELAASGASLASIRTELARRGMPAKEIEAELATVLADPLAGMARSANRRRAKLETLLRIYQELWRQAELPAQIERFPSLTCESFYRDYYFRNRPVILTQAVQDWPALAKWNLDYFDRFSAAEIEITDARESDPNYEFQHERHLRRTTMGEFLARLRSTAESNDFYLVARNEASRNPELARLLDDVLLPRPYLDPGAEWRSSVSFWMGPKGTVTPLHHDHMNFFFVQVRGAKQFKLFPAFELPRMYNDKGVFSPVDPAAPDAAQFPEFQEAIQYDLVLEPGESLFLPVGWWHWVKSLELTISVSFKNFRVAGGNTPWPSPFWL